MYRIFFSLLFVFIFMFVSTSPSIVQGAERRDDDAPQGKIVGNVGNQGVARTGAIRYTDPNQNFRQRANLNRYQRNALRNYNSYNRGYPNAGYGTYGGVTGYGTYGGGTGYGTYGGAYGYPNTMNDSYGSYGYPNTMYDANLGLYGNPNTMYDPYYGTSGYNNPYSGYPNSGYPNYPNPYGNPGYYYNPGMYNPNTTFVNPPSSLNSPLGYPGYSETYFRAR